MRQKILTIIITGSIVCMALNGCGDFSYRNPAKADTTTTYAAEYLDGTKVEISKEEAEEIKGIQDELRVIEFDSTPFQQKYWVIFTEGYRNNRVEVSTFDSTLPADQLSIIWDSALEINDSSESDGCDQYYLDDNDEWIYIMNYYRLSDKATNVLASNLNVVDRDGNVIISASPYSMIDWDEVDSFK